MAEDFEFNQDTLEQFKQFQKLKRKKALETIGTGLRNAAEGVSATLGNRAARFRGAPDESDTFLTPMQKAEKSAPIIKQMEEREQFYFGAALEDAQMRFQEQQRNARSVLQAATQHESTTQRAAAASSRNQIGVLAGQLGKVHSDADRYTTPSKDTVASAKAILETSQAVANQLLDQAVAEDPRLAQALAEGADKATLSALEDAVRSENAADAQEIAKREALQGAQALFTDLEPSQIAQALTMLQQGAGISHEELTSALPEAQAVFDVTKRELDALTQEATVLEGELSETATHTWPDSGPVREASAALAAGAQRTLGGAQGGPQEVAGGTTVSEVEQQAQAQGGAPGAQEAPPQSPYGETYFNDPDLPPVSGDANQRMEDILDLIEQHPEKPPLQEARSQLLQSPDFKKFQTARGYQDPDVAFREMRRELRHKKREQKDLSERKVAENVSEGQAPGPESMRSRVRKLARPPSTPVQGSVSRTPVEVETGGKTS